MGPPSARRARAGPVLLRPSRRARPQEGRGGQDAGRARDPSTCGRAVMCVGPEGSPSPPPPTVLGILGRRGRRAGLRVMCRCFSLLVGHLRTDGRSRDCRRRGGAAMAHDLPYWARRPRTSWQLWRCGVQRARSRVRSIVCPRRPRVRASDAPTRPNGQSFVEPRTSRGEKPTTGARALLPSPARPLPPLRCPQPPPAPASGVRPVSSIVSRPPSAWG